MIKLSKIIKAETIQCSLCKHCYDSSFDCKAYPNGIPEEILIGKHDHKYPYSDDNGIIFEPI